MSQQPERPSPVQSSINDGERNIMAQMQIPQTFPTSSFTSGPEQRPPGPQLAPIHSIPAGRPIYENGRLVQLPPIQLPASEPDSTTRTSPATRRAIPVTQLLSAHPPSPPRPPPIPPEQQLLHHISATNRYKNAIPDRLPRPMPSSSAPLPTRGQYQSQGRPPQTHVQSQSQFQPRHLAPSDQTSSCEFSPTLSTFSTQSCTHSQASSRSHSGSSCQWNFLPRPRVTQIPPFEYVLSIRQQPAAARACGFGERDRRVIDPPPILELKITDRESGAPEQDSGALLALHCTLLSPNGHDDETEFPPAPADMSSTRRLMGTLVASPYQAKDENTVGGTFFVFPDLSCRSPGRYRLRFNLLRVDPMNMTPGAVHGSVASVISNIFSVYTAKEFPGMRASSALLKALRRQGLNVGVKKGSEARKIGSKGKAKHDSGASSSEREDDSGGERGTSLEETRPGSMAKARKRGERRMKEK